MTEPELVGAELGAYRIRGEIGSGGMGSVYRAEVTGENPGFTAEREIALKIVHADLLAAPGFLQRFVQEAELGKRVRHANVVRTYAADSAVLHGRQYRFLVMEYVEGRSLRQLLAELGRVPETLLREIALRVAAGLSAIHAHGIVHRDIKPENVLITDDHDIRLMDLGVAKLLDQDVGITSVGCFAGSLLYAAPEHFAGEPGASTDLYSLGVLLHELASGANPFPHGSAAALIRAHAEFVPPRLADVAPATLFFSEVVAQLLAKQPEDRFESADRLREVLEDGERSDWWTSRVANVHGKAARVPRVRVRRDTRLHGREAELRALRSAWQETLRGQGKAVLIEGEAGIGKTRLVDAFLRETADETGHALYGSYAPSGGLGGLSDAILAKFGQRGLAHALAPYLKATPALVPAFAARIKHESPPAGAAPLPQDALAATCVQLMRSLAEEGPLIWVIEDLDFAAAESRALALALARATEQRSALLVFTTRSATGLADFSHLSNCGRITADRLGARDVFALLEDALKNDVLAEKLGARIARKSDGVPLFVFELIHGLAESSLLRREADGAYVQTGAIEQIEVPSAVRDLIDGRLRSLSAEQRRVLDVAAVIGMEFDPGIVVAVLEEKRVRILQHLAEIERGHGLVHGEAGTTRFDQHQVRQVLYQELPPDLRAEYHTLVADAYAAGQRASENGERSVVLAMHRVRGNRPRDATAHLAPALGFLERTARYDDAMELATIALEVPQLLAGAERAEVLLRKALRHRTLSEHDVERELLDEAERIADDEGHPELRARVGIAWGLHLWQTANLEDALVRHRAALQLAREAGDEDLEEQAAGSVALVLRNVGRYDEARVIFEANLERARTRKNPVWETAATLNMGLVALNVGNAEEARSHLLRALALARQTGDRTAELNAQGNLGLVFQSSGRLEKAREQYEKTLAIARETGNRRAAAYATGNLGSILSDAGRLEEAEDYFERTYALAREIGDRRSEARTHGKLGTDLARRGRLREGCARLERCLELARSVGSRRQEGEVLARLAVVSEAEGDLDRARSFVDAAIAVQRNLKAKHNLALALAIRGRLAFETDPVEAGADLEEAAAIARETGAPNLLVFAATEQARSGGDLGWAETELNRLAGRIDHEVEMEARLTLWERTGDDQHLREAGRLLRFLHDHAPEADRDGLLNNVPRHAAIVAAGDGLPE